MTTEATAAAPLKTQNTEEKPKRARRVLTLEQFRRRYSDREDGYKPVVPDFTIAARDIFIK